MISLTRAGVDEAANFVAGGFVGVGGAGSEFVRGAVNVGIFVRVEIAQAVDHALRLLRGGGVVEPDQRLAVDALLQDRKIAANGLHVERLRREIQAGKRLTWDAEGIILGGNSGGRSELADFVEKWIRTTMHSDARNCVHAAGNLRSREMRNRLRNLRRGRGRKTVREGAEFGFTGDADVGRVRRDWQWRRRGIRKERTDFFEKSEGSERGEIGGADAAGNSGGARKQESPNLR